MPEPGSRDLLEAVGVALYMTDADGRITFFNEAAAGCNELIRSGRASICLEPNDLLRAAA